MKSPMIGAFSLTVVRPASEKASRIARTPHGPTPQRCFMRSNNGISRLSRTARSAVAAMFVRTAAGSQSASGTAVRECFPSGWALAGCRRLPGSRRRFQCRCRRDPSGCRLGEANQDAVFQRVIMGRGEGGPRTSVHGLAARKEAMACVSALPIDRRRPYRRRRPGARIQPG